VTYLLSMAPLETSVVNADQLFRNHARYVATFLRRLGVPDYNVDDGVQEVFIVVHKLGGYIPGPATCKTWLGAITIRIAANIRRHNARVRKRELDPIHIERLPGGFTPETLTLQRAELDRVGFALNTLSVEHQRVLLQFNAAGESCDDIAQSLGIPTGTVYSRLHTARKKFELALDETVV